MKKLTEKQKAFADEYIIILNATQAAIKAGYSKKTANEQGARLLANVSIKEYVAARLAEKEDERIAKQDEVLRFLTEVMRGEVNEEFAIGLGMGEQRLVRKELDGAQRIKAAELLGKRYGIWKENVGLTGNIGVQIVDDVGGGGDE